MNSQENLIEYQKHRITALEKEVKKLKKQLNSKLPKKPDYLHALVNDPIFESPIPNVNYQS